MSTEVLVVDDDESLCEVVRDGLRQYGYAVEFRTRGADALELAAQRDFAVVITDLNLERMSGLEVCRRITENRPDVFVIVITAFGDMQSAISAIRAGAHDFINKPFQMEALAHTLDRAVQHRHLREEVKRLTEEVSRTRGSGQLLGRSAAMRGVISLLQRVSDTDATVLLTGDSGTGKELVARALHSESQRAGKPFVAINCAAMPANLLESELFGHTRGAFTDAKTERRGLFEQAKGGTILLDEVGEMPLEIQPKLLRVLQDRKLRPLGANVEVSIEARIVAATNRDLENDVERGLFREDLYYRLNVVQIHLPPLRARGNDILLLAQHFVETYGKKTGKPVRGISSEAAKKLIAFDWPGNVRQLENSIERAVTLTRFEQITVGDLPEKIQNYEDAPANMLDVDLEHSWTLEELERRYIERVLRASKGNKTQAAKVLGLDRRTLYRKLERFEKRSSSLMSERESRSRKMDNSQ